MSEMTIKFSEFFDVSEGHFGNFWIFYPKLQKYPFSLFSSIFSSKPSLSSFYDFIF